MSFPRVWLRIATFAYFAALFAAPLTSVPVSAQQRDGMKSARDTGRPGDPKTARRGSAEAEEPPEVLPKAVQAVVDAHPQHDLVLCMGGCGGAQGRIIWQRPRIKPGETDSIPGLLQATAGGGAAAPGSDDIICVAGCNGSSGTVLWRGLRVAWLGETSREDLAAALREAHAQLNQGKLERRWMNTDAREHLGAAMTLQQSQLTAGIVAQD